MSPWRFQLLGYQLGFARPAFLLLVLAAGVCALAALLLVLGRQKRIARWVPMRLQASLAPGVATFSPGLQALLYGWSLGMFALALAQPQFGARAELAKRRGIDLVVALDASKSMLARDVAPSRLDRAKLELTTMLDALKGDRVAMVVFAGDAFVQCPLTSDYSAAKLFLRAVDPDAMPQGGTNIGAALLLSRQLLENADRGAKDKVVVLLSDGEDLTGEIAEGIDALKEGGIRVYVIGIGSDQGEPIPLVSKTGDIVGYKKDSSGNTVVTRLDRAGLVAIAQATGGEFFHEPRGVAIGDIVELIDRLQKTELEARLTVRYAEAFQYFVVAGLVGLIPALLLRTSARRRRAALTRAGPEGTP